MKYDRKYAISFSAKEKEEPSQMKSSYT